MNIENKSVFKVRFFVFSFIFILGFVFGSFFQRYEQVDSAINEYVYTIIAERVSGDAVSVFINSFLVNFIFLVVICIFYFSHIGIFFNLLLFLCLGIGKGALITNLICNSGIYGLGFSALTLLPGLITSVGAFLLFSAYAVDFSKLKYSFKKKICSVAVCLFWILFSAGLDVTSAEIYKVLT